LNNGLIAKDEIAEFVHGDPAENFYVAMPMRVRHEVADQRRLPISAAVVVAMATAMWPFWSTAIPGGYAPAEHDCF